MSKNISRRTCISSGIALTSMATSASFAAPPQKEHSGKPSLAFLADGSVQISSFTIPISKAVSPEAATALNKLQSAPDLTRGLSIPLDQLRRLDSARTTQLTTKLREKYPVEIEECEVAGVLCRLVKASNIPTENKDKILINFHWGAFILGRGSVLEAIPIAAICGIPVLAVDYRVAPEHPFPAAVEDGVGVYRELLKTHAASAIGIYGSSAGAILTAQVAIALREANLSVPAALGFFSGTTDWSRPGDSEGIFGIRGFSNFLAPVAAKVGGAGTYLMDHDRRDPRLSPIFADLRGFPPTLCMTGTRDLFLSGTCNFHRALRHAGVDAELMVYDAMPHVHWTPADTPEAVEALGVQAQFFARHLK